MALPGGTGPLSVSHTLPDGACPILDTPSNDDSSNAIPSEGAPCAVIFLTGPTGSGKSALALWLAERFPVEILNADSVALYRGMNIGTAKPSPEERCRVPHHLLDVTDPETPFSAGRYVEAVRPVLSGCRQRGTLPVFVGGTGLYLRAVAEGLAPIPPVPEAIQMRIRQEGMTQGWPRLHERLRIVDPELAARLPTTDAQRIARALAVAETTGIPLSQWWTKQKKQDALLIHPPLKIALEWPRPTLYTRIDTRFDQMMANGLLDEVRQLHEQRRHPDQPAYKAVGYRQLLAYLDGKTDLSQAVTAAKQASRRYAKRQLTWLRQETHLHTFPHESWAVAARWIFAHIATLHRQGLH
jgi:tRNA dimethylallyltransferase